MITDLLAILSSEVPFTLAWKRARHIRHGHPFSQSSLIETQVFTKHPQNGNGLVYAANLMQCNDCGLRWLDVGFQGEPRK